MRNIALKLNTILEYRSELTTTEVPQQAADDRGYPISRQPGLFGALLYSIVVSQSRGTPICTYIYIYTPKYHNPSPGDNLNGTSWANSPCCVCFHCLRAA